MEKYQSHVPENLGFGNKYSYGERSRLFYKVEMFVQHM